jgi:hypothetical protein
MYSYVRGYCVLSHTQSKLYVHCFVAMYAIVLRDFLNIKQLEILQHIFLLYYSSFRVHTKLNRFREPARIYTHVFY